MKYRIVLNEPLMFPGGGYFLEIHAPGKRNISGFLAAVHHATLCQAEGPRVMKGLRLLAEVDTTYLCACVEPFRTRAQHQRAALRADTLLNRLFIKPTQGLGYLVDQLPFTKCLEKNMLSQDEVLMQHDFGIIG